MKRMFLVSLLGVSAVIAGCASSPETPKQESYSGYLENYSNLRQDKTASGEPILRYVSPKFTPARYRAFLLEPVVYYPKPQPNEHVSQQALDAIRDYMDQALQREFGKRFQLAQQPGEGVARVNIALTAVGSETVDLKPYQYLPVALVATGAKAAVTGGRPEDAVVQFEAKVTDSTSNERLYSSVRRGSGERLTKETPTGRQVTVQELRPLIDKWAQGAAAEASRYVAKR